MLYYLESTWSKSQVATWTGFIRHIALDKGRHRVVCGYSRKVSFMISQILSSPAGVLASQRATSTGCVLEARTRPG